MLTKKRVAATVLAVTTPLFMLGGSASQRLNDAISTITSEEREIEPEVESDDPLTTAKPKPQPKEKGGWIGKGFTYNETVTLEYFQSKGITDRAALAVILGNIKQESRFHSNICEGGARIGYNSCRRGGYGLIQWTSIDRYRGLGYHASKTGGDPSNIHTQLSYLVTERQWRSIEWTMKQEGHSINTYMRACYRWIGWGIHGARTHYAHQYYNQLVLA